MKIKALDVKCVTPLYAPFPKLLFAEQDGKWYADATAFIEKSDEKLSMSDFIKTFAPSINKMCDVLETTLEEIAPLNSDGHMLLEEHAVFFLIAYTQPVFYVYISEVIREVFINGLFLSDEALIGMVQNRFSPEIILQIFNNNNNEN